MVAVEQPWPVLEPIYIMLSGHAVVGFWSTPELGDILWKAQHAHSEGVPYCKWSNRGRADFGAGRVSVSDWVDIVRG